MITRARTADEIWRTHGSNFWAFCLSLSFRNMPMNTGKTDMASSLMMVGMTGRDSVSALICCQVKA